MHEPPSHTWEQHSGPPSHCEPATLHEPAPQASFVHDPEQHCPALLQPAPSAEHPPQTLSVQEPPQQSSAPPHASPWALQVGAVQR